MISKVISTVEKYNMLKNGSRVIIGLSGGADSVALTSVLLSLKDEYGISLSAVHVNHGIRGEEADRDERFVTEFCKKFGIELKTYHIDVPSEAKKTGESEEECARRLRYRIFENEAGENDVIATAHNLNDSAETFFINLLRGTGLRGLCGIPAVRGRIIRPLISCSRDEIEAYCRENSLEFVTDSTNLDDNILRNKVRHSVLPLFTELNESFLSIMSRNIENNIDDEAFISSVADEFIKNSVSSFSCNANELLNLPSAVRKRVIDCLCFSITGNAPEKKHIDIISEMLQNGGAVQLDENHFAVTENGVFSVKEKTVSAESFCCEVDFPSEITTPYAKYIFKSFSEKDLQFVQKNILENCFDCDKIKGKVFLRSRKEGDSFRKNGRGVSKTLKKLFIEEKIPVEKRNCVAVLSDDNGVFWVEGFGIDERVKISEGSKHIINIQKGNDL